MGILYNFLTFGIMRNLNRKDYIVLAVVIAMAMPVLLAFNGNPSTWYINIIGIVYAVWLVRKLSTSKLGHALTMRLERIEDKLFAMN